MSNVTKVQGGVDSGGTFGASSVGPTSFTNPVGVGNTVVVLIVWQDATQTVSSVKDDKNNTYILSAASLVQNSNGSAMSIQIAYLTNILNGPKSITVTWSSGVHGYGWQYELSASVLDQIATGNSGASTSSALTTNTVSCAAGGYGLCFAINDSGGIPLQGSPGAGWTTDIQDAGGQYGECSEYQSGLSGNTTGNMTAQGTGFHWIIDMIAFKPAPTPQSIFPLGIF